MQLCKLEIFIPKSHLRQLQGALQSVGAGHIGNYDSCMSYSDVVGVWRPLDAAKPYSGKINKVSKVHEIKVEVRIESKKLKKTLAAIKSVHPYETPVINVIPLLN